MSDNFTRIDLNVKCRNKKNRAQNLILRYAPHTIVENSSFLDNYKETLNINTQKLVLKSTLENDRLREAVNNARDMNFHQRNYIYQIQDEINLNVLEMNKYERTRQQRDFIQLRDSVFGYIHEIESLFPSQSSYYQIPIAIVHICLIYNDEENVLKEIISHLHDKPNNDYKQSIYQKALEEDLNYPISKELPTVIMDGVKYAYSKLNNAIYKFDTNKNKWSDDVTPLIKMKFKLKAPRSMGVYRMNILPSSTEKEQERASTPPYIRPQHIAAKMETIKKQLAMEEPIYPTNKSEFVYDDDVDIDGVEEKQEDSIYDINRLINIYDRIIENLMLRYDLGILRYSMSQTIYSDEELHDKTSEINWKSSQLIQTTVLENFDLKEMLIELLDECKFLDQEIISLEQKEANYMLILDALIKLDQLRLKEDVRRILKNDKFNLNHQVDISTEDENNTYSDWKINTVQHDSYKYGDTLQQTAPQRIGIGNNDNEIEMDNETLLFQEELIKIQHENNVHSALQANNMRDNYNGNNVDLSEQCKGCRSLKEELAIMTSEKDNLQIFVNELLQTQDEMKQQYETEINELKEQLLRITEEQQNKLNAECNSIKLELNNIKNNK